MKMSLNISKVPRTYSGKLMMLEQALLASEESFDDGHPTTLYSLTEAEWQMFELIQTLGSDFAKELSEIIDAASPTVGMATSIEKAKEMLDVDR